MSTKIVWTIAGSDTCGGAGIQADMKTFHNFGVHSCSVITAITAQNLQIVKQCFYLSPQEISAQIHSLNELHKPDAIKIGMLGNLETISVVRDYLQHYSGIVVLDPLMLSSSGNYLFSGNIQEYQQALMSLLPCVDVLTPNIPEAESLLQRSINTSQDIEKAALDIIATGARNVVIKGGHAEDNYSHDYWSNGNDSYWLSSPRVDGVNCHGTGCIFSSALAAVLAQGYAIKDAVVVAKMYINRGLRAAEKSLAPTFFSHGLGWPEAEIYLPFLSSQPLKKIANIAQNNHPKIGLYPVVDSVEWLQKLLPLGIKYLQFRVKNKTGIELEDEISRAILLARQYQARLFINDYWQQAIRFGAYGVHLGQEDLNTADIQAIHDAGLQLGISTHCYHELARAHACQPAYIAFGPIYATTSKAMTFAPQGITMLARWRRMVSYPLVAIGGIDHKNINDVLDTNVDGVAMISAITQAQHPEDAAKKFINKVNSYAA